MANPIQQQPEEPAYGAGVQAEETEAIGEAVAAQNAQPPIEMPMPEQQQQEAQPEEKMKVNNLLRLPPGVLFKNRTMPDGSNAASKSPIQQAAVMSQMWDVLANSPGTPDAIKALARIYRIGG